MDDPKKCSVPCVMGIIQLEKECEMQSLKLSHETSKLFLFQLIMKLGASQSQKLISKFVADGIIEWDDDFEVESILDHCFDATEGEMYYLIKWLGWSKVYNTWEPKNNLLCSELLEKYHILNNIDGGVSRKRKLISEFHPEDSQFHRKKFLEKLFIKLIESRVLDKMSPLAMVNYYSPVKKRAEELFLIGTSKSKPVSKRIRTTARKKRSKSNRKEVKKAIEDWQNDLNKIVREYDPAPLFIENEVDFECRPQNFIYVNQRKEGVGVHIPEDPLLGCDCTDCFVCRKTCCPVISGSEPAYYRKNKRLKVPKGVAIFECNRRCKCGPDCINRVVQKGRKYKVCIFRTANGRGWGVKTLQTIRKGSFVMEYVGEVITNEEAERRGKEYDYVGLTYLFDLDFHDSEGPYSVDAGKYGNAAHFINHSCSPNLEVHVVWINTLDPRFPHICFFAKHDIEKDEELTFDYLSVETRGTEDTEEIKECEDPDHQITDAADMANGKAPCYSNGAWSDLRDRPVESTSNNPSISEKSLNPPADENAKDGELWVAKDLPTPPASDTESITDKTTGLSQESRFSMPCLCGADNCRKFLFF